MDEDDTGSDLPPVLRVEDDLVTLAETGRAANVELLFVDEPGALMHEREVALRAAAPTVVVLPPDQLTEAVALLDHDVPEPLLGDLERLTLFLRPAPEAAVDLGEVEPRQVLSPIREELLDLTRRQLGRHAEHDDGERGPTVGIEDAREVEGLGQVLLEQPEPGGGRHVPPVVLIPPEHAGLRGRELAELADLHVREPGLERRDGAEDLPRHLLRARPHRSEELLVREHSPGRVRAGPPPPPVIPGKQLLLLGQQVVGDGLRLDSHEVVEFAADPGLGGRDRLDPRQHELLENLAVQPGRSHPLEVPELEELHVRVLLVHVPEVQRPPLLRDELQQLQVENRPRSDPHVGDEPTQELLDALTQHPAELLDRLVLLQGRNGTPQRPVRLAPLDGEPADQHRLLDPGEGVHRFLLRRPAELEARDDEVHGEALRLHRLLEQLNQLPLTLTAPVVVEHVRPFHVFSPGVSLWAASLAQGRCGG